MHLHHALPLRPSTRPGYVADRPLTHAPREPIDTGVSAPATRASVVVMAVPSSRRKGGDIVLACRSL